MLSRFPRLTSLLLALTLAVSLTACAESPPPDPTATPEADPAPTATAEAVSEEPAPEEAEAPAGETLVIMADELRAPIFEALSAEFETANNVTVEVQTVEFADLLSSFQTAALSEDAPDILVGPHDWLGELVSQDLLSPLALTDRQRANFLPSAISGFTYQDDLYGLPYAVENVAFFRNTQLVPEAPQTWSDVLRIATELEAAGSVETGFALNADAYHYYPIQTAFGGYVFGWDELGRYDPSDVGLDSDGALAAAQWLSILVTESNLNGSAEWETLYSNFEQGNTAMLITGPWALERFREAGVPYALSPLPAQVEDGLPFVGIQGLMVNANSEQLALAQIYLTEFILTEATMQALFEANLRPPAYLPTRRNIADPDLAAFAAAGSNGLPMPAIPEMSLVWDTWETALDDILTAAQPAEAAFTEAAEAIRETIERQ